MGFSPLDLINRGVGLGGVRVTPDVAYGADARQRLDVYRPARITGPLPVVVFFYGGSWQGGNRADYGFVAALLVRRGFIVVVPDYRVYPQAGFPAFLQDAAAAVALVFAQAAEWQGDASRVFLMGHSAGAYNAAMLALAPGYLLHKVAGVVGLAGPYDFLPLKDPVLKTIFGPDLPATQPVNFVTAQAPPMFLATGAWDTIVMPRNTTALAARLARAGVAVERHIYPRLGHVGILLALLPVLSWRAPVLAQVVRFCQTAGGTRR